jgi:hypothetical protein
MATKKARKERTPGEKSADFKALAGKHAGTALGAIHRLSKLARPSRYSWTPEQVKILEKAFSEALGDAFARLKNPPQKGVKLAANIFDQ